MLKHLRPTKLTEHPTVFFNMLDDIDTDLMDTQVESIEACQIYDKKVSEEDADRLHVAVVRKDLKTKNKNLKNPLNFNNNYDQYQ